MSETARLETRPSTDLSKGAPEAPAPERGRRARPLEEAVLALDSVAVTYRAGGLGVAAATLQVQPGEVVALTGPNGAGKTSTVRAVSGFLGSEGARVSGGSIRTLGHDTANWEPHRIARLGLAFIPERRKVFANLTVEENLLAANGRVGRREREAHLAPAFELFPVLADRRGELAGRLSGGQQQMLSIARAVTRRPEVLIVDETTLGLHHSLHEPLAEAVRTVASAGTGVLVVDEHPTFALAAADHCYTLVDGVVGIEGTPGELSQRLGDLYLAAEGAPAEPTAAAPPAADAPIRASRPLGVVEPGPAPAGGASGAEGAALVAAGLSMQYGGVRALDDVSFALTAGTTTAVIGPNGAGKSSLLNALCGVDRARRQGTLSLEGVDCTGASSTDLVRRGVGRTFQEPRLIDRESVLENVLSGAPWSWRPRLQRERRERAMAVLETFGLVPKAHTPCADLPFGQRKLVDVARALVERPRILLLDEPSSGLDHGERSELEGLLGRIRATDLTILMVEHHMGLVRATASRTLALDVGRLLVEGPTDEVLDSPEVRSAYV